ncbi:DUF5783 family protein [Haloarchaeobius litoreus]|uniref:DUF5783 family protein n=1 Tax=Haloarchaeobius litoreus TaxID=755306 RepID=A0ABD6DQ39_9EURY|nr:DUF5783 family protein [Haloarchaeobius litoreus]
MTEFDPDRFEAEKYVDYFQQLQRAYKNAFETMNEEFDSTLIHGIDQQVLNESEPFYDEDEGFTVELPDDPHDRLTAVVVDEEKFEAVMERYREEIRSELRRVFGL